MITFFITVANKPNPESEGRTVNSVSISWALEKGCETHVDVYDSKTVEETYPTSVNEAVIEGLIPGRQYDLIFRSRTKVDIYSEISSLTVFVSK